MNPDASTISSQVLDEAAMWLARRDAGLNAEDQDAFDRWLASNSSHAAAWRELTSTWQAFDQVRRNGDAPAMVQELARRKYRRRWRASFAIAASVAVAAVAVLLVRPEPHRGVISRTQLQTLPDGSVAELDRGAAISVNYLPDRREVSLLRGQALFTVAKNPARPFIVSTGGVAVQAVGTAFSVQAGRESVDVLVTEGKVTVKRTEAGANAPEPVFVTAGFRVQVGAGAMAAPEVEAVAPAEMSQRLAWRGPRIELSGTRLRDAVELINRESSVQLRIADARLGDVRMSGVFRADDAEGFARLLESNFDVVSGRENGVIELRSKSSTLVDKAP